MGSRSRAKLAAAVVTVAVGLLVLWSVGGGSDPETGSAGSESSPKAEPDPREASRDPSPSAPSSSPPQQPDSRRLAEDPPTPADPPGPNTDRADPGPESDEQSVIATTDAMEAALDGLDEVTRDLRAARDDPSGLDADGRRELFRRGMAAYDKANALSRRADETARAELAARYPEFRDLMEAVRDDTRTR